jgi:hypothetical protein
MRWGVRDENTSDHMTWIACSRYGLKRSTHLAIAAITRFYVIYCRALEWCKEESSGVFFFSLQADK